MDKKNPPTQEVIDHIDKEWPALRKALLHLAAKHASQQEAEDIVAQSYRGIRSGSRVWDREKEPDFAVFAGMVVVSNAKHWRAEAFNRRRNKGSFDETSQRRVAGTGANPEQVAILKQEFARAFATAFRKGSLEDRLFEAIKRGITQPVDQAEALGVSVEKVRQLVARVHEVCNRIIQEGSKS
jgi:hypothetical protein